MKRDLLDELGNGIISVREGQELFDAVLDGGGMGLGDGVGMSRAEYTAYGYGVPLDELAAWRKNGWPDICPVCGKRMEISRFGWIAKEQASAKKHFIKHLDCGS